MTRFNALFAALSALLVGSTATSALAEDGDLVRSITTDGLCVYVDWTQSPPTVTPATNCQFSSTSPDPDPCVEVDWTQTPPTATEATGCP